MGFINKPYLPVGNTEIFIADKRAKDYLEGINYIPSFECGKVMQPVASHPDMTVCHIGGSTVVAEKSSYEYYYNILAPLGFRVLKGDSELKEKYPYDIAFNCVILKGVLFHKLAYTDKIILDEANKLNLKLIDVRQGYTKCSTLIVDENSVITGDPGLHKIYRENGFESLLVSNDNIFLDGFENGFIGGAGGLVSGKKMAFFGNIEFHPQYNEIKRFLEKRNIKIITLGTGRIYDFGSIITLKEVDY